MSRKTVSLGFAALLATVSAAGQMLDHSPLGATGLTEQRGQTVFGEIRNIHGSVNDLVVLLTSVSDGRALQQVALEGGGAFELNHVSAGTYILKVVRPPGEVLLEQVTLLGSGQTVILHMPDVPQESKAATISKDELQHPLSGKGAMMLRKAQKLAHAGNHAKAIEELKNALSEPTAVAYAHSILGTEYLKTGQVASAETELKQAVQMMPHDAVLHSNLGYALFLKGDRDRGEQEVRKALELDRNNSTAQRLLGIILQSRGGTQ